MTRSKKGRKNSKESKRNAAEASMKDNVTDDEDRNAKGKDNNDPHSQKLVLSPENSKKGRIRGKSKSDTSKAETFVCTECDNQKLDCSDSFLGNLEMQKLIAARISDIESGKSGARSIVNKQKYKLIPSTSQGEKQKATLNTRDEMTQDSSKQKQDFVSTNESGFSGRTLKRTRIMVRRRAPAANLQNVAEKQRDAKDNTTPTEKDANDFSDHLTFLGEELILSAGKTSGKGRIDEKSLSSSLETEIPYNDYEVYEIDCSEILKNNVYLRKLFSARPSIIESETTENKIKGSYLPAIFMTDKSTQTDPLQEPPDISHADVKNKSACNMDAVIEAKESDLLLPSEKSKTVDVLEDIDIWKNSGSNLNSFDQNLQCISDDFLRDLRIANESLTDGFIKCLMNER